MATLTSSLGIAVLAFLVWEVALTLFPTQGSHGGPGHRGLNKLVWAVFHRVGLGLPASTRPRVLSLAGPTAALVTLTAWVGALVVGFALLYLSATDPLMRVDGGDLSPWVGALYYSGYVATTLGLGDVVVTEPVHRLATVVESMAGFGLFAAATSYVLTVTREVAHASAVASEVAAVRTALEEVVPGDGEHAGDLLERRAESWARDLLHVANAHAQYPLAHYFRPVEDKRSLVVQVGWLLAISELSPRSESTRPGTWRLASDRRRFLRESLRDYLALLNRGCVPSSFEAVSIEAAPPERLYTRLLRHLDYEVDSATPEAP